MAKLSKRQKQIGFAVVVLLPLMAFVVDRLFGGPSPEQARSALAESNLCAVDAPIEKRDGKLFIGDWEVSGREFRGQWGGGEFAYESSPAGGRWVVSLSWRKGGLSA